MPRSEEHTSELYLMENAYVSNDECLLSVHIGFPKSQENESLNTKHQHA